MELRSVDSMVDHGTPAGPVVDWICSGIPTELPIPEAQTAELLAERDLLLFEEDPADSAPRPPRTRIRRLIGYVTPEPEVARLARMLADLIDEGLMHPMLLAAQWIEAGYSPDAAAGWVTAGVVWPGVAQTLLATELDPPDPCRVVRLDAARPTHRSDRF